MNREPVRPIASRPVAVDLFSGAGGLSLGLEQAGFDVILAVDRDPHHVATFKRNFPLTKTVRADIANLDAARIRKVIGEIDVDLVSGGPPCQGFSHIGKRNSSDPRNMMLLHFVRLVTELRPKAFLMENVPGLQASRTKSVLEEAIKRLARSGYLITEPVRALDASRFGVPQRRERIFVVGTRTEFRTLVTYPTSSCKHRPAQPSVWESIRDLPSLSRRRDLFKNDFSAYRSIPVLRLHRYAAIARGEQVDPCDLAHPRIWDSTECSGCSRVRHRKDVVRLYAATAPGAMVLSHHLPKLNPKGLSPTLRAGTDSEHGSFNAPRPIHPYEPRCISVREAARLHGYPDWFRFFPAKWHAHRQIGNSVCPPVARALGFAIRRALQLRAKRPTEALRLAESFELSRSRGKRVRRISQLIEWPKVLAHLLLQASPSANGKLRKPDFSVRDVAEAYRLTGARMTRTPASRLLSDIARSRNRRELLDIALKQGYSIARVGENGKYGRFVPIGTPSSLESTPILAIGRSNLEAATRITTSRGFSASFPQLIEFLQRPSVRKALLHRGKILSFDRIRHRINNRIVVYCAIESGREVREGIITIANHRNLPTLSSLRSLLIKSRVSTCIVVSMVTRRHLAGFVVLRRGDGVFVRARSVFEASTPSSIS
jgi:DNA (cytosine-5)-methyltransferase 1